MSTEPTPTAAEADDTLPPALDVTAMWDGMSQEDQALLGKLALLCACTWRAIDSGDDRPTRLSDIGEKAFSSLSSAMLDVYEFVCESTFDGLRTPDLNQVGIRSCTSCGCTDVCGCFNGALGCHWVGPTLCSACAPAAPIPGAVEDLLRAIEAAQSLHTLQQMPKQEPPDDA